MQRQGISYGGSEQIYANPNPNVTGANIVNFTSQNTQPQQVKIVSGSQVQGRQVISQQQVNQSQGYNTVNVQPSYVGSSDNYGYGFSQQKEIRNQQVYGTSASIPKFETVGGNFQSGNVQYSGQNVAGSSGVRGTSFVVNPSTITTGRPVATIQSGSVVKPVTFIQPQTTTFVQPTTTTYVQPTTTYTQQQQTTTYAQPITTTYTQQTYQPLQQTSSKAQYETLGTKWAEQEFQRPKYPKLYNNSAEYYRNLAPEDDPTVKKTCCSPCCWILVGLIGLLAVVFGILCGLGIFCGGSFNFTLPSGFGRNETAIIAPTGPQQPVTPTGPTGPTEPVVPVTPTGPQQPVQPVTPIEPVTPITPIEPVIPIVPIQPVIPITPTYEDNFIDPSVIAKVPIKTTSTQDWSTSSTWATGGSTRASTYGSSYVTPSTDFIDPSVINKVPVTTTNTYTTYPSTTATYGYDLGYQPTTTTGQNDFSSVPLSSNPDAWSPTFVEPITATYQ